ncbi:MAG: GTPase Era [Clostridia bacterium]|nr:GTPase Era [Clostridia bacterium]
MEKKFKSGFVSVIGRPNVGKSTLINQLLGERITIISSKPQTTRNSIRCIYTDDKSQVIFIDTPGIHKPMHKLGEYMVNAATESLKGVDVIIAVIDASMETTAADMDIIEIAKEVNSPVILVLNKVDKVDKSKLEILLTKFSTHESYFDCLIPVSAKEGSNTDIVLEEIIKRLPEGPLYFPPDITTDVTERFVVSEFIREKILELTSDEIPHGTAVEVESMKERSDGGIIDIEANIYCEKDSHKGIIIGKQGKMLKEIGSRARADLEKLLDCRINLQLWVKVRKNWRDNNSILKSLGYK